MLGDRTGLEGFFAAVLSLPELSVSFGPIGLTPAGHFFDGPAIFSGSRHGALARDSSTPPRHRALEASEKESRLCFGVGDARMALLSRGDAFRDVHPGPGGRKK